jgi:transcription elongation factor Elf1
MITIGEVAQVRLYTDNIIHCPSCNRNSNFLNVVKKDGDKYYLGTKCTHCDHYDDFKNIPARMAADYPAPTK